MHHAHCSGWAHSKLSDLNIRHDYQHETAKYDKKKKGRKNEKSFVSIQYSGISLHIRYTERCRREVIKTPIKVNFRQND